MTNRKINYLVDSKEFQNTVSRYNLSWSILNDELLILKFPTNLYIQIYGYVRETHFYFDVFSKNLEHQTNLDQLLEKEDSSRVKAIFKVHNLNSLVRIPELQGNLANTLEAENHFFTYLEFINTLLSKLFQNPTSIPASFWWTPIDIVKANFQKSLDGITWNTTKSMNE